MSNSFLLAMKKRADLLLMQQGGASSRNEAQALILAGLVFSSTGRIEKAGQLIPEDEAITVKKRLPFVGRGGLKLDHALREFRIDVADKICLDVGASTGGFTDCLLQRGARKVYAVDVGYGQFHARLRNDPRVVLFEKCNFRRFDASNVTEPIDLAVADVSFISLDKILPKIKELLGTGAGAVVLVKPQFELSPKEVKKGVVRSETLREKAVGKIRQAAGRDGFEVKGEIESPIAGPKGNREILLYLK